MRMSALPRTAATAVDGRTRRRRRRRIAPDPTTTAALMRRAWPWVGAALVGLAVLVGSGLLLADRLTPRASGAPSHALPPQPAQTSIDRELAPLLADQPGKTGVLLLADGLDAFAARALATRKAGRSLDLQYYMWHDDLTGRLLAREVHAAAERGVRVRLLLDDLNAEGLDPQLMALDAHPRIELRLYNPFRNREGVMRLLEMVQRVFSMTHRMHNKAWIVDGRVAIVGGRNIGEEYFSADAEVNFRDLDLLLFGPAVQQASTIFDAYWNSAAAVPIDALNHQRPARLRSLLARADGEAAHAAAQPYLARVAKSQGVRAYFMQALAPHWTSRLEIVADPPMKGRDGGNHGGLTRRLLDTLGTTRHEALLISPYFVPGDATTAGLVVLVERGARVAVATNSLAANDVPAVHGGYARYRGTLLDGGVRLYEMKARGHAAPTGRFGSSGASLHTKAFVVDDARGFVGSYNLDPRSANLNTEMGVLFDDRAIAADVQAEYLRLTGPALSYWVSRDRDGELRWLDRASSPVATLEHEPDTSRGQRAVAWLLAWLPIESQL